MFGIDQISWEQFIGYLLLTLFLWYLSVILWGIVQQRFKSQKLLFEDDTTDWTTPQKHDPIKVSSDDYPSGLVPFIPEKSIPLPVSFYEESGLDDGYSIDRFRNSGDPLPETLMQQIQFQQ